ncbi:hypothetical protein POM88_036187 [Heracleum sosnowskyi]|uniref:Uncharacterized protein n=1 Tax=Heracleum sosnowskyi TaxID=360622 RepID=A0AAD8MC73_9APIA|nr:hypothetical protein POM88_036187 [Heracleum sosnowskyi]
MKSDFEDGGVAKMKRKLLNIDKDSSVDRITNLYSNWKDPWCTVVLIERPRYLRKIDNDIDMAMNPLKILYDMDSEDEQWILRIHISLQTQETSCRVITDDLFEKTMIC